MRRVAITGIGIVSCLGTGVEKVAESLKNGKSGIRFLPERLDIGYRSGLSSVIDDFEPPKLSRKQRKTMTEFSIQAYAAALEAIKMSGWSENEIQHEKTGLIIGNDSSGLANIEQIDILRKEKSTFPIGASLIFQVLNSTVTMNLNTIFKNTGASWTLSSACSSGGHAIGQAADLIAYGRQDRVICGGAQEINWESVSSFDATNAFSTKHESPEEASRPFDKDRDGLVPGGGAAIVLLENYDMAKKRGANILGELYSYAFSSDGAALSAPSGEGLGRAIKECVKRADIRPEQVDLICAHATSTPLGDIAEARAINSVFGEKTPWVSCVKSMTGHEMWMSGASQVVYTMIMGQGGFVAPNINFVAQEEGAPSLKISQETIEHKSEFALLNSAGFGGTNSCLLLKNMV